MVPAGGHRGGRRGRRTATLAALLLLASSAAVANAAIWDNWPGFGGSNDNNQQQGRPGAALPEQPKPKPSVVQSIFGGGDNNDSGAAVDAGAGIPAGLDLSGVDPRSLITPKAAGHVVPPGQCGIYTRGEAEVAICIDSVVDWGADIRQTSGFLVNRGAVAVCDLVVQPALPQGATLASFWPDWALENLQEIYLDPGLTTAIGASSSVVRVTHSPPSMVIRITDCIPPTPQA